ncbi:MAG: acetylglutamate kinase [Planctomycetota bacterium]|nr:acetylglutamate kinase [Planctomycetota bacterium]MDA1105277.1 acetylglutamate kinase [Planctomycetota bacterium]
MTRRSHPLQPIIIKVGGAVLDDATSLGRMLDAVAAMHRAQPGSVVLVHGGGAAIERALTALGMTTMKRHGIRVTPPEQMPVIAGVLGGTVNATLVSGLLMRGVNAQGMRLLDGALAACERVDPSLEVGEVGRVVGGDPTVVRAILAAGTLPVIASIGATRNGALLNVNADDAAAALVSVLGARGLALLTDVAGIRGPDGTVATSLDAAHIDEWISLGIIHGGMVPKVKGALAAAAASGAPVTIASWQDADALAALAQGHAAGTTIACPTCAAARPQEVTA